MLLKAYTSGFDPVGHPSDPLYTKQKFNLLSMIPAIAMKAVKVCQKLNRLVTLLFIPLGSFHEKRNVVTTKTILFRS